MSVEELPRPVVAISRVSRRFGHTQALDSVDLVVPKGVVLGLVGMNGAGKTTLIKHVLGLLRPQAGRVSVFGRDPVADPVGVLSRIGYLAETNELPEWMSVDELLRFTRPFYPSWDDAYAASLLETFEIDPSSTIKRLSKGHRARVALTLALAHRAELLVLDEPSSGLDPLVRRDILRAVIRTIADEGRTVLFSSHLLDEVERVSDRIAIIDKGAIVDSGELDLLKSRFQRLVLRFAHDPGARPAVDGVLEWEGAGRERSVLLRGGADEAVRLARELRAELVERTCPTLSEIFVGLLGRRVEARTARA